MAEEYADDPTTTRETALIEYARARQEETGFQKWLLDDEVELSKLEMALTGKAWNNKSQQYVQVRKRKMTDEAADTICWTILYPMVKNAKLSRFTSEEINQLMYINMIELTNHLNHNMEEYAIALENLGIILAVLETFLKSVFNRAYRGMEQERLTETTGSEERQTNAAPQYNAEDYASAYIPQPQKKRRFGFLNF